MIGLSDEIIKVLDYLCGKLGIVIDWTNSDILPYIKELIERYIQWETYTSLMWIIFGLILFVICTIIILKINKIDDEDVRFWVIFSMVLIYIISIIIILSQTHDIITAKYFPEKLIYEYCTNLLNNR